jgi:hypothetical protein
MIRGKRPPRVGVDAEATTHLERRVGVDDLEVEVELPPKLDLPLPLEHRRAEDQDATDAATEQKLFEHEAGLHGLAEANAIGEQETHTGHRQRTQHRFKLIVVDLDGRVPDAEKRFVVERLGVTQTVDSCPAVCVDKRTEGVRGIRAVGIDAGQRCAANHLPGRFDFPEKLLGFGKAVVIKILNVYDVPPTG